MSEKDESQFGLYLRDMLVSLLTAVVAFTGYYFSFTNHQGAKLDALRKELFAQQAQITDLKIRLSKKYESTDVLRSYLDGMPYPAWLKTVEIKDEEESFAMWHINRKYENMFDVSNLGYRGKSDFEIWSPTLAQQFYNNDVKALRKMRHHCEPITLPTKAGKPDSKPIMGYVCNWTTTINGKVAIAGQILLDKKYAN